MLHVSTYHHSQKLLDQFKIFYFLDFLQYCIKLSSVSLVLWSGFVDFTARKLSVEHLVSFGAYSKKHNQVWTKDLGTDIYQANVRSDKN